MPYKDNAKRLAYQREYEARMRADKGPKGEAWREYRRRWWRKYYAENYAANIEFRTKLQTRERERARRRAKGGSAPRKPSKVSREAIAASEQTKASRLETAKKMLARAQALAAQAIAARQPAPHPPVQGYTGRLNMDGR